MATIADPQARGDLGTKADVLLTFTDAGLLDGDVLARSIAATINSPLLATISPGQRRAELVEAFGQENIDRLTHGGLIDDANVLADFQGAVQENALAGGDTFGDRDAFTRYIEEVYANTGRALYEDFLDQTPPASVAQAQALAELRSYSFEAELIGFGREILLAKQTGEFHSTVATRLLEFTKRVEDTTGTRIEVPDGDAPVRSGFEELESIRAATTHVISNSDLLDVETRQQIADFRDRLAEVSEDNLFQTVTKTVELSDGRQIEVTEVRPSQELRALQSDFAANVARPFNDALRTSGIENTEIPQAALTPDIARAILRATPVEVVREIPVDGDTAFTLRISGAAPEGSPPGTFVTTNANVRLFETTIPGLVISVNTAGLPTQEAVDSFVTTTITNLNALKGSDSGLDQIYTVSAVGSKHQGLADQGVDANIVINTNNSSLGATALTTSFNSRDVANGRDIVISLNLLNGGSTSDIQQNVLSHEFSHATHQVTGLRSGQFLAVTPDNELLLNQEVPDSIRLVAVVPATEEASADGVGFFANSIQRPSSIAEDGVITARISGNTFQLESGRAPVLFYTIGQENNFQLATGGVENSVFNTVNIDDIPSLLGRNGVITQSTDPQINYDASLVQRLNDLTESRAELGALTNARSHLRLTDPDSDELAAINNRIQQIAVDTAEQLPRALFDIANPNIPLNIIPDDLLLRSGNFAAAYGNTLGRPLIQGVLDEIDPTLGAGFRRSIDQTIATIAGPNAATGSDRLIERSSVPARVPVEFLSSLDPDSTSFPSLSEYGFSTNWIIGDSLTNYDVSVEAAGYVYTRNIDVAISENIRIPSGGTIPEATRLALNLPDDFEIGDAIRGFHVSSNADGDTTYHLAAQRVVIPIGGNAPSGRGTFDDAIFRVITNDFGSSSLVDRLTPNAEEYSAFFSVLDDDFEASEVRARITAALDLVDQIGPDRVNTVVIVEGLIDYVDSLDDVSEQRTFLNDVIGSAILERLSQSVEPFSRQLSDSLDGFKALAIGETPATRFDGTLTDFQAKLVAIRADDDATDVDFRVTNLQQQFADFVDDSGSVVGSKVISDFLENYGTTRNADILGALDRVAEDVLSSRKRGFFSDDAELFLDALEDQLRTANPDADFDAIAEDSLFKQSSDGFDASQQRVQARLFNDIDDAATDLSGAATANPAGLSASLRQEITAINTRLETPPAEAPGLSAIRQIGEEVGLLITRAVLASDGDGFKAALDTSTRELGDRFQDNLLERGIEDGDIRAYDILSASLEPNDAAVRSRVGTAQDFVNLLSGQDFTDSDISSSLRSATTALSADDLTVNSFAKGLIDTANAITPPQARQSFINAVGVDAVDTLQSDVLIEDTAVVEGLDILRPAPDNVFTYARTLSSGDTVDVPGIQIVLSKELLDTHTTAQINTITRKVTGDLDAYFNSRAITDAVYNLFESTTSVRSVDSVSDFPAFSELATSADRTLPDGTKLVIYLEPDFATAEGDFAETSTLDIPRQSDDPSFPAVVRVNADYDPGPQNTYSTLFQREVLVGISHVVDQHDNIVARGLDVVENNIRLWLKLPPLNPDPLADVSVRTVSDRVGFEAEYGGVQVVRPDGKTDIIDFIVTNSKYDVLGFPLLAIGTDSFDSLDADGNKIKLNDLEVRTGPVSFAQNSDPDILKIREIINEEVGKLTATPLSAKAFAQRINDRVVAAVDDAEIVKRYHLSVSNEFSGTTLELRPDDLSDGLRVQPNVSINYKALADPYSGFDVLFQTEPVLQSIVQSISGTGSSLANQLSDNLPSDSFLPAFFTQFIYQGLNTVLRFPDDGVGGNGFLAETKDSFIVLLRVSLQDAVTGVLSDNDVQLLKAYVDTVGLDGIGAQIRTSIEGALDLPPDQMNFDGYDAVIKNVFEDALDARIEHGSRFQILPTTPNNFTNFSALEGRDIIAHNGEGTVRGRAPIAQTGEDFFIVAELRGAFVDPGQTSLYSDLGGYSYANQAHNAILNLQHYDTPLGDHLSYARFSGTALAELNRAFINLELPDSDLKTSFENSITALQTELQNGFRTGVYSRDPIDAIEGLQSDIAFGSGHFLLIPIIENSSIQDFARIQSLRPTEAASLDAYRELVRGIEDTAIQGRVGTVDDFRVAFERIESDASLSLDAEILSTIDNLKVTAELGNTMPSSGLRILFV